MADETDKRLHQRLRIAQGQIQKLLLSVEKGDDEAAVAQQFQAVEKGISSAKRYYLTTTISKLIDQIRPSGKGREQLGVCIELSKYLEKS